MRIVFAGTPEFAAAPLRALLDAGFDVVGVLTQPDRPAGRGRRLQPSPVRVLAQERGIPQACPVSLKTPEAQAELAAWQPDLLVVIAYGLILPQAVLDLPPMGCVNLHASLLPRWRGAAPIQRAIAAGDAETGLCLMQMEAGLDTGPVLAEARLPIQAEHTAGSLHDDLVRLGCAHLPAWLQELSSGALQPQVQPAEGVSYAHKLSKDEALLDLQRPAAELARLIRAYDPWPVAHLAHAGEHVRLFGAARALELRVPDSPGSILDVQADGVRLATTEGVLLVPELQWPGRRRMPAADALRSRGLGPGDRLG